MKQLICYLLLAVVLFTACKKDNGPIPKDIGLDRQEVQPQVTKDGGSQAIDVLNLDDFNASFKIGLFTLDAPAKMDIVIRKNNLNATVKVFKADVTTFPSSFTLSAAELASLFGTPVALNDSYDISADYYTASGKKYEAYPVIPGDANKSIFGYGSGVSSQPGASLSIQYKAICAYDPAIYEGNFVVVQDKADNFSAGDVVELTKIDNTHFSMLFALALDPVPVTIGINVLDNGASVPKQSVGSGWDFGPPGYPSPFVVSAGAASASFVSPCDQTLTLSLNYGYAAGTFGGGPYTLVLKKQ